MNKIDEFPKFPFCIEVSAPFALFTNKKDERMSYDVPTSGALRGFIESIFWKPAIRYVIRSVEVLNPVRRFNMKRNELKKGCNADGSPVVIDNNDENSMKNRIQRNNVYLRDVRYRIHAELVFIPRKYRSNKYCRYEFHEGENPLKYYEILKRRVQNGQHRHSPYLGTRDCMCDEIEWIDGTSPAVEKVAKTQDMGMMYIDYAYPEDYDDEELRFMEKVLKKENNGRKAVLKPRPLFSPVRMIDGVVVYPNKYDLITGMFGQMRNFWGI